MHNAMRIAAWSLGTLGAVWGGATRPLHAADAAPAAERAAAADGKPNAAEFPPADGPDPKTAADASYTAEKYIKEGLPAHDRDWTGDDMVQAEKILTPLSKAGNQHLPRYASPRSGKVFARLTSPDNLDFVRDPKMPLEGRLQQSLKSLQGLNQILFDYISAFSRNEVDDVELVELMGMQLRSIVVLTELTDEVIPTIRPDDPNFKARMEGIQTMKRGLAMLVSGCLTTLTEREYYRVRQRLRMLAYIQECFPPLLPKLPDGARAETLVRIEAMEKDAKLKELHPGLARLRAALEKTAKEKPGDAADKGAGDKADADKDAAKPKEKPSLELQKTPLE